MIPFDHILIDGNTALWVAAAEQGVADDLQQLRLLDRPCDTCGGTKMIPAKPEPHPQVPGFCLDCDGTGRHTFHIHQQYGYPETLRVHVLDVLPIVENASWDGITFPVVCRSTFDRDYFLRPAANEATRPITLPPAAEPGMWAIRLAVHTRENVEEPCDCDNGRIWTYYGNGPWYTIPCPDCTPQENVDIDYCDGSHTCPAQRHIFGCFRSTLADDVEGHPNWEDPTLMRAALVSSDVVVERIYRKVTTPENVECRTCGGKGTVGYNPCYSCSTPENVEEPT